MIDLARPRRQMQAQQHRPFKLLAAALMIGGVVICSAGTACAGVPGGDPAAGRADYRQLGCAGCHGRPGYRNAYPNYPVPRLGGQQADYLVAALKAYADGKRRQPVMQAQASSLSATQMRDIAAFLAASGRHGGS